ncbi:hypothetical protein CPLU01_09519 [Colletotrichum plurivorum]|uniref:Uncharacterized protein n=1 Tax=Colletotrichum plurivorum TaxID=2175906 RepID=A0A8H6K863_9PEZI|nr:hypothetical protein CPLU01_09519 [Colletotrichum plurivorum]
MTSAVLNGRGSRPRGMMNTSGGLETNPKARGSTLPALTNRSRVLMEDLEWLALHNTNLREIAFEMPSSGHYPYDLFENAGIKALRRVDDEPVMW